MDSVVKVPLRDGMFALIDPDDQERVLARRWYATPMRRAGGTVYYAKAHIRGGIDQKRTMIYLHRFILNAPRGVRVDHINRDTLDCRKVNLRLANASQNGANSICRTGKFKGVAPKRHRFTAQIMVNRESIRLGVYETAEQAAVAYDNAARRYWGEFARLNFPDRHEPDPPRLLPVRINGRWSANYEACISCGGTNSRYTARGLCRRCYNRTHGTNH